VARLLKESSAETCRHAVAATACRQVSPGGRGNPLSAADGKVERVTTPTTRIEQYFVLAAQPDAEPYFAQFAPGAVVEDDGQTHVGIDAVRGWRRSVPGVAYDVRAVAETSTGSHVATTEISGDFPGSPVLLGFAFTYDDAGLISRLVIAP
jgi:hypothetical protein